MRRMVANNKRGTVDTDAKDASVTRSCKTTVGEEVGLFFVAVLEQQQPTNTCAYE